MKPTISGKEVHVRREQNGIEPHQVHTHSRNNMEFFRPAPTVVVRPGAPLPPNVHVHPHPRNAIHPHAVVERHDEPQKGCSLM